IARQLGGERQAAWLAAAVVLTTPMAIAQASGVTNDLLLGMWLLALLVELLGAANPVWIGFAAGLAFATKGTAYLFVPPILVWYGLRVLRSTATTRLITARAALWTLAPIILLNLPQIGRN